MPHPTTVRAARRPWIRIQLALVLAISAASPVPALAAQPPGDADPAVITKWNGIAAAIIPGNPAAFLNYAFVHLAMYNAVNGITREYQLYQWNVVGPPKASPEAAAAVAAHSVLMANFGGTAGVADTLNAHLAASLADVIDGVRKRQGIKYGLRAADHIIALRTGDGRFASVAVPLGDEAGEWRPTPPLHLPFAVPWLGGVKPLAVASLTQFDPGAPPAIGSDLYRAELAEVRAIGAADATGGVRDLDQELTARYFAAIPFGPMQEGLRGVATSQAMDISDSARLFAATNTSIADAIGTAWNAKLRYMWWRPITAIHQDANDPDTDWASLLPAPPYPEWPSGLCSVIGAMTASLQHLTGGLDLTMGTEAQGYRTWTSKEALDGSAIEARIWSGIHFRTSDEVAIEIGNAVTNDVLNRYFAPTR